VLGLALRGFEGPEWDRFNRELAKSGHAVMSSWIRSGRIYHYCMRRGVRCSRPEVAPSPDDARDIATDIVVLALGSFRETVLIAGRWDHTRGAPLATFFVGHCLYHVPNAIRRWDAARRRAVTSDFTAPIEALPARDNLLSSIELEEFIDGIDDSPSGRIHEVMLRIGMGFGHQEIAATMGMTPRAVEAVVYRHRKRAR
jgi:DNA-directed RNA polymerase specialized sigma24 family protein